MEKTNIKELAYIVFNRAMTGEDLPQTIIDQINGTILAAAKEEEVEAVFVAEKEYFGAVLEYLRVEELKCTYTDLKNGRVRFTISGWTDLL
jgi:hypothetical protein